MVFCCFSNITVIFVHYLNYKVVLLLCQAIGIDFIRIKLHTEAKAERDPAQWTPRILSASPFPTEFTTARTSYSTIFVVEVDKYVSRMMKLGLKNAEQKY